MIEVNERVAALFAERRNRRRMLRDGAALSAGMAAMAGSMRFGAALAQDATPQAHTVVEKETTYLFVQAFQSGTWTDNGDDTYQLVLRDGLASTIYFSDQPNRIFGVSPTEAFIEGLDFIDGNAPNAAIVVESDGAEVIEVVELFNPVFEPDSGTLTYTVKILEAYTVDGAEEAFSRMPEAMPIPPEFGMGALFIDDCQDGVVFIYSAQNKWIGDVSNVAACCYTYPTCKICDNRSYDWVIWEYGYTNVCGQNNENGCYTWGCCHACNGKN